MSGKDYSGQTAQELISQGYRRVSNKYRDVSRIDRPDWEYVLAERHAPWNPREGLEWVRAIDSADFYRRCETKDEIKGVPEDVFRQIPSSNWDKTGYVPIPGQDIPLSVKLSWNKNLREESRILKAMIEGLRMQTSAPCGGCARDGFSCDGCHDEFYAKFQKR